MIAYIYARFSTLEQGKGSSLARQLDDCRAMCDRYGWDWSIERELTDEGRSAFDGANRAAGSKLATFEQQAISGELPPDTVLVVERIDRLSRQSVEAVFQLVTNLTNSGVAVALVDGERLYRKGSFDFANLIELIVKAQLSHEESEKKSQRVAAAWAKKRARAQDGDMSAMTKRCPAWLAVDKKTGRYALQDDRAAVVRRIFSLATSGCGKYRIARTLNQDGVPVWGRGNGWHVSYIQKILTSRATIGEMQPHRMVHGKREPDGEPIANYYPAAINEETFARAQSDRLERTNMRGRRGKRISNLFSGLAKCAACGGTMTFRNKGSAGEQYLVCDAASRGHACDNTMHFHYPGLEETIIDQTLHIALTDRHYGAPAEVKSLEGDLAKKKRELDDLAGRERRLVELLSRVENQEIERQLREIGRCASALKSDIATTEQDLLLAKGAVSPEENIARIRKLADAVRSEDDDENAQARGTVQQALRSVIRSITCDPESEQVLVELPTKSVVLDRRGKPLVHNNRSHRGFKQLVALREQGFVVPEYEDHPVLGKVGPLASKLRVRRRRPVSDYGFDENGGEGRS